MTEPDLTAVPLAVPPAATAGFQLNRPTIVALLYLVSFVTGFTMLIGVILAYVWRGEAHATWEDSHFRYHIRTFWIGMLAGVLSVVLMFVLVGIVLAIATAVWLAIRTIKAMLAAQREEPIANVESWLW